MKMDFVIYASRLVAPLGHDALIELLDESKRKNAKAGLTGFLYIENQVVLQYLEGPPHTLMYTVQRIRNDPRHTDFAILTDGAIDQRYFDGWQMALVESATLSLFDLMGVEEVDIELVKQANPIDLINLLSANASFLRDRPSVA